MIYLVTNNIELFECDSYKIISVKDSLKILNNWEIIQYDSETDGIDAHINKLLCVQFGNEEGTEQIVVDCSNVDITSYKKILENKLIIGQNLKFDLQFLYNYNIIPRNVYDTMIIEQLLYLGYPHITVDKYTYLKYNHTFPYLEKDDNYSLSFSLKAIAKKYLNVDIDKTVRGEIIWRGLDSKVIEYAAADCVYLGDIRKKQLEECEKKKCLIGAKLENYFVPVIAYLEWCGIKLDADKWGKKMEQDKYNLDEATKKLSDFVIKNGFKQFYTINTQGDLFEGFNLDPIVTINWSSSRQVVNFAKLLGFNTKITNKKGEESESVLEKHLKTQKGINDEFLDLYFKYQEYAKVVSSFGQGHLNMINPKTGRCHTTYWQLGAASGRMSCGSQNQNKDLAKLKKISPSACTYCNMQQLPSDERTRSCFVPEKGNYFCSSDFSALESRLGADIYKEQSMIDEFLYRSGDIHSLVAKACFPELQDKTTEEIKRDFPHLRKKAKPIGFSQQLKAFIDKI